MKKFIFYIQTKTKEEIKDPKGQVVEGIIKRLDLAQVNSVRVGKFYEITIESSNLADANQKIDNIAKKILTNPLVETYTIVGYKEV